MFLKELIDHPPTVEKYGPNAALFDIKSLGKMLRRMGRNNITDDERKLLREAGTRGIPTREGIYVPNIN